MILHAGLLALNTPGGWRGALITGRSGAGKSDLALRCLDAGFCLVADDRVEIWRSGAAVYGAPPPVLAGLIEVRGQGVRPIPHRPFGRIDLVADCAAEPERLPDPAFEVLLNIAVPRLALRPLEASAPLKLRLMLLGLGTGGQEA